MAILAIPARITARKPVKNHSGDAFSGAAGRELGFMGSWKRRSGESLVNYRGAAISAAHFDAKSGPARVGVPAHIFQVGDHNAARAAEIGAAQVGAIEIDAFQIGARQPRAAQIGA